MNQSVDEQFKQTVAARYGAIKPALLSALNNIRHDLHADPAHAQLAAHVERGIDAAFLPHWPETSKAYLHDARPEIRDDVAIATLIAAKSPYYGHKNQMMNPQLLGVAAIKNIVASACEASGIPYDQHMQNIVRQAVMPLVKAPSYDDHQMGL